MKILATYSIKGGVGKTTSKLRAPIVKGFHNEPGSTISREHFGDPSSS